MVKFLVLKGGWIMDYTRLFEPGQIGALTTKNRIIMAPMGNINMADPIGRPLPKMIEYFTERARGGTGLIITGLVPVSFGIDHTVSEDNDTTYFPRIDGSSRTRLAGWRDLAASVKAYDSKLFIQLTAGLGRVGSPEAMLKGKILRSASLNWNFYVPLIPHLPLSTRQIKKIVKSFGQAAVNAKVSGIDGIHLHGHEGYLMDQLTSKPWNRRWIGRYRNLHQFALDVVAEIKNTCGQDFPVIYRIDLTQGLSDSYGPDVLKDRFRNMERTVEEGLALCTELARAGINAFDVDKGCYDNWFYPHPPAYFNDMPYVEDMAGRLKQHFQKQNITVPVIAVGKLGKPEVAEHVLAEGWADYIMLGRPLLADPYWPQKTREGRTREIVHCIGDQEGCIHSFLMGGHPCCAVNPYAGFEDTKSAAPAVRAKRIAVIGGGPGGCEAARTAWHRGHEVVLYEKSDRLGGQLHVASSMKTKHDLARYLENLLYQMDQLGEEGLHIRYKEEATSDLLASCAYDAIICCTGLKPGVPPIPGLEHMAHKEVQDFIASGFKIPDGVQTVAVLGGGLTGCEVAYTLAAEKDVNVIIIEKLPSLMQGVVHANRSMMLWMLMGLGSPDGLSSGRLSHAVVPYVASQVVQVEKGRLIVKANKGRTDPYTPWTTLIPENIHNPFAKKLDPENTEMLAINCDYLVVATGGKSDNALYYELMAKQVAPEIYIAGDAMQPGGVWEAVANANELARRI